MWRVLLLPLSACAAFYNGSYIAEVTTTIDGESIVTTETVEFVEGSLKYNELFLRREDCELRALKHGGFGLQFDPGAACPRDGETWTLISGDAPNDRGDTLVIDLVWDLAAETLRISL